MVIRSTAWPQGAPCWVDLAVPDVGRAAAFYQGLFGWEIVVGSPEAGGYSSCLKDGKAVAGIGSVQDAAQPVVWTTYLAVDDADKTSAAVAAAGGRVLAEPFDVMDLGRMAVVADTAGAAFGLWQSGSSIGVEVANEVATLVWNDQFSPDLDGAKRFYATVFGFTYDDVPGADPSQPYAIFKADGRPVGGMGPGVEPAHWLTYFQVSDADAAVLRVAELGGTLIRPAADSAYGRIAIVSDDQGATFAIIEDNTEN